jgi:hypothetical protein
MRWIDYNTEQYKNYARGRELTERQLQTWISACEAELPDRRRLTGLDVGSGTGRFTPGAGTCVRAGDWRRTVGPHARDSAGSVAASGRPLSGRLS